MRTQTKLSGERAMLLVITVEYAHLVYFHFVNKCNKRTRIEQYLSKHSGGRAMRKTLRTICVRFRLQSHGLQDDGPAAVNESLNTIRAHSLSPEAGKMCVADS